MPTPPPGPPGATAHTSPWVRGQVPRAAARMVFREELRGTTT